MMVSVTVSYRQSSQAPSSSDGVCALSTRAIRKVRETSYGIHITNSFQTRIPLISTPSVFFTCRTCNKTLFFFTCRTSFPTVPTHISDSKFLDNFFQVTTYLATVRNSFQSRFRGFELFCRLCNSSILQFFFSRFRHHFWLNCNPVVIVEYLREWSFCHARLKNPVQKLRRRVVVFGNCKFSVKNRPSPPPMSWVFHIDF